MGKNKTNTFKKAIHHLKSKQIDEKLELLNEIPTNNSAGIYVVEPEYQVQDPDVPGEVTREANFTQDALVNGRDTTGLFDVDGTTILTIEPPDALGDKSFILGPMASMWYSWGNFSTIGYIRQSDRRMVDLGRITGQLGSWNGTSGFTSYGQLLLNQAVWFRDTPKLNGADNNTPNYRSFYPGPPSNSPDQYGRYLCVITGTPKPTTTTPPPRRVPPVVGGFDPNLPPGSANPYLTDKPTPPDLFGDLAILLGSALLAKALISALGMAGAWAVVRSSTALNRFLEWYNKGRNTRIPDENNAPWRDLLRDDRAQRGQSDASYARGENPPIFGRPDQAFNPFRSADKGGPGSGPTPAIRQAVERPFRQIMNLFQSYELKGQVLSEEKKELTPKLLDILDQVLTKTETVGDLRKLSKIFNDMVKNGIPKLSKSKDSVKESKEYLVEKHKRILKEIKKPYVLPEQPKVKYTFKPKVNRTINPDLMKKAEVPTSFKPMEEKLWGKYEKDQNTRWSQERKNEVLDHLGGSDHAWEYMTETSRNKNNDIMYGNFGDSKKKIVRKEELKGDTLLFIVDENGKKESILQSELSIEIANEYNKELFSNYFQEQETLQADKDPLFKKVSKRLKKEIDYDDKPSSKGYPNDPPPEMVNGWHPEYGNKSNYYNTLDPHSANSMPATGNAEIDAKVRRAKTLKRVLGKKA